MNIQPRVRFQAQQFTESLGEWWDVGHTCRGVAECKESMSDFPDPGWKRRIVRETTTFEVVEEMEPTK